MSFGNNWDKHEEKIKRDWESKVTEKDLVILPGDFSWEINLKDTCKDFEFLNNLYGKKLLLKGNHDYWWNTIKSMKSFLEENNFNSIDFLYNNSYEFENHVIVGTRGWTNAVSKEDERILKREIMRLELSLQDGVKKYGSDKPIIVCMHYPPTNEFIKIMRQYSVKKCIYGHLHGAALKEVKEDDIDGIEFRCVSCDYTDFKLVAL